MGLGDSNFEKSASPSPPGVAFVAVRCAPSLYGLVFSTPRWILWMNTFVATLSATNTGVVGPTPFVGSWAASAAASVPVGIAVFGFAVSVEVFTLKRARWALLRVGLWQGGEKSTPSRRAVR